MSQVATFRAVRDQFFDPAHRPASTLGQVSRLFREKFLIEVEAIAVR
ncbi:MAG TPA: RidA family protein [Gemmatimonadaceae bacterium]|nr:RidA family protein [Gemmatimonadaceae bacterium]